MDMYFTSIILLKDSHLSFLHCGQDKLCLFWVRLAVGVIVLTISCMSSATLITSNYGNNIDNLTLDTSTGLEWLDLQESMYPQGSKAVFPLTYHQVKSELQSGGLFDGFRFATLAEIETLFFESAAIQMNSPDRHNAIGSLIHMVSDHYSEPYGPGTRYYSTGYYDYQGGVGLASLEVTEFAGSHFDGKLTFINDVDLDLNSSYDYFASWLVRSTIDVPESGKLSISLVLLVAGVYLSLNHRKVFVAALQLNSK